MKGIGLTRIAVFCILGAVILLLLLVRAYAFKTFRMFGGTIHQNISSAALTPQGISEASFQVIDDGNTSQDIPETAKFSDATHHCDNSKLAESFAYIQERTQFIIEQAFQAHRNQEALKNALYAFGELLHTAQDFYSHTNYIELNLKRNVSLRPEDIPLFNWDNLKESPPQPAGIKSGYFYYENPALNEATITFLSRDAVCAFLLKEFKDLKFASSEEFKNRCKTFTGYILYASDPQFSVLHYDLNKDASDSMAGSKVVPATGKNLFEYAFNLAVRETERQWLKLEGLIRKKYPEDAKEIIEALKSGKALQKSCPGIEKARVEFIWLNEKAGNINADLAVLSSAHAKATDIEVGIFNLLNALEDLKRDTSVVSEECKKASGPNQGIAQLKSSFEQTGIKVSELRKITQALSETTCQLAQKAKESVAPDKRANLTYNAGQFAKKTKEKSDEAGSLAKEAKASLEKLGLVQENRDLAEFHTRLDDALSKLKDQRDAGASALAFLKSDADAAYGSLDALINETGGVSATMQQLVKACPNDPAGQRIFTDAQALSDKVSQTHKEAAEHFKAIEFIVSVYSTQLSRAENLSGGISNTLAGCDKIQAGPEDINDLKASLDAIEAFAQAAEKFAAEAEKCLVPLQGAQGLPGKEGVVSGAGGVFVESLVVPNDKPVKVLSKTVFEKGKRYIIEAGGIISDWQDKTDGVDPVWCYAEWRCGKEGMVWDQLRIDGMGMTDIAGKIIPYNPGHTYRVVYSGEGRPVEFYALDAQGSPGDNSGSFGVNIYTAP